jgi:hypothetical protein
MRILPRRFAQVLNDALVSLGRTWRPLVSTALMVFVPAGVSTLVIFELTGATDFLEAVFDDTGYLQTLPSDVFLELARPFIIACLLTLLVQGVATIYVYMVCHRVMVRDMKGETTTGREARRPGLRPIGMAVVAGMVAVFLALGTMALGVALWMIPASQVGTPNPTSSLVATLLLFGLIGPGLWLAISLSMVTATIALEGKGVVGSLYRSRQLVKGRWWQTFGFLLLVGLMGSVAIQLIQLVAIPLAAVGGLGPGVSIVSLMGLAAQGPIVAAMGGAFTHWYVDLRARREVLLADQL